MSGSEEVRRAVIDGASQEIVQLEKLIQACPSRASVSSTSRVVLMTLSGLRLIESIPSSTRNSAMSG